MLKNYLDTRDVWRKIKILKRYYPEITLDIISHMKMWNKSSHH